MRGLSYAAICIMAILGSLATIPAIGLSQQTSNKLGSPYDGIVDYTQQGTHFGWYPELNKSTTVEKSNGPTPSEIKEKETPYEKPTTDDSEPTQPDRVRTRILRRKLFKHHERTGRRTHFPKS